MDSDGDPVAVQLGGSIAGDDESDRLPGERLKVYAHRAAWVDRKTGDRMLTTLPRFNADGAFVRGEIVIGTGNLWQEAAALAWMAHSPHDIRPHLLLLCIGEAVASIEPCMRYGRNYLAAWCLRARKQRWHRAYEFAAADALALVYWGRETRESGRVTLDQRADELKMSADNYGVLRAKMARAYRMRLIEAIMRFSQAMGESSGSGGLTPAKPYHLSRENELLARSSLAFARRAA